MSIEEATAKREHAPDPAVRAAMLTVDVTGAAALLHTTVGAIYVRRTEIRTLPVAVSVGGCRSGVVSCRTLQTFTAADPAQAMMMWPEPKKPGRRKWKSSTPGFIYFAKEKFQRFGPIKIGWATDPARRVADLQMGNPRKLIILGTTPGTPALERLIHRHFADDRGSGEWFRQSPDLVALAEGRLTIDPASIAESTKAA